LPEPEVSREDLGVEYAPPSTPEEEALAEIWAEVLGVDQVGVYDNFFELGGDSILSIQVVARANQRGLNISPKDIFQNPTIAGLAAVAAVSRRVVVAEQGEVTGEAPLTPIQQWFFQQDFTDKHHWNQSLMFQLTQSLDREALAEALRALLAHHDALRLRFVQEDGGWKQVFAAMGSQEPLHWFDLSDLPDDAVADAIQARAAELQAAIDLDAGQLFHAGYFHLGEGRPPRLLLIAHHLAMDGVSWRILLEDLQMAYLAASSGRSIELPPKTTSFKYWAERLAEHAMSPEVTRELDFWLRLGNEFFYPLPADEPYGENTEASVAHLAVSLGAEETEALLKEVPKAYRTSIDEILLAALARTLFEWTYDPRVLVHLEGHGRVEVFEEVDHSRTVGWFTNMYPVLLDISAAGDDRELILAVKEQMRAIPDEGFSYGLLRYLNPETADQMAALPEPEIAFNYLGQFDQALPENALFRPAPEGKGHDRSPHARRPFLIGVNGCVAGGRLSLQWSYSRNIHHRETIQRLAEDYIRHLQALIAHCLSPDAGGVSASDFELADLSQRELDKILKKLK
jgi:non-ribosomal peptide synthase protein (TIGR01720 family)